MEKVAKGGGIERAGHLADHRAVEELEGTMSVDRTSLPTPLFDPEWVRLLRASPAAIQTLQELLSRSYIEDGCRDHPELGCESCDAIRLHSHLSALAAKVQQDLVLVGNEPDPASGA